MAVVVIAGRTNVGKSTLFNRLIGRRKAITEKLDGVTRDAVKGLVSYDETVFTLYDTCGVFEKTNDPMLEAMRERAFKTFQKADLILFVVDGRSGITSDDEYVADQLRKTGKKVILVINKAENMSLIESNLSEFLRLGFEDYVFVSAQHGKSTDELLDKIAKFLKENNCTSEKVDQESLPSIAIVGKPNVGKSSLFNALVGEDRATVTPIPGTTRDPIDEVAEIGGKKYIFVDTAGMRRKSRIERKTVERFSVSRTIDAIESADVVLLVMDATEGITHQDKRIADLILSNGRAMICVMNKFDLSQVSKRQYEEIFHSQMPFANFCRIVFTSAVKKVGLKQLIEAIDEAYESYSKKIPQNQLSKLVSQLSLLAPNLSKGELRIYSVRQVKAKPPKFVVQVNKKEQATETVSRTLQRLIRETVYPFCGSPIILIFKGRENR
ncbi:ribosome biogenesis GTPase Der [Pseudothermotoga sp. U03pept]|uniref:ribosome biogenesis GTPase Der n=1 Tax=Pseudothermotoga sp. U03pept TaxID=3447012 RepID=UPI003F0B6F1F